MHAFLADIGHSWLANATADLRRYVVFAVSVWFILWVALAAVLRGRKIRETTPQRAQLEKEFLFSVRSIMVFSTVGIGVTLMARAGLYPLAHRPRPGGPVVLLQPGGHGRRSRRLLLLDAPADARPAAVPPRAPPPPPVEQSVAVHRLQLRRARGRADGGLHGALAPGVPTPWAVTSLFVIHQIFRNTLLHCGYELMPMRRNGKPWLDFLTTTTHHDLHHGQAGYNYAAWFTWWDRWMGTEHPEYHARYAQAARRPYITLPKPQPAV